MKDKNLWNAVYSLESLGGTISDSVYIATNTGEFSEAEDVAKEVIMTGMNDTDWSISSLVVLEMGTVSSIKGR